MTMLNRAMSSALQAALARLRAEGDIPVLLNWGDDPDARVALGEPATVQIRVRSPAALPALLAPSLDRLGEAYVEGWIDVDGAVADIMDVAWRLSEAGHRAPAGSAGVGASAVRLSYPGARHTVEGDRAAIEHHYDVSNAFYAAWLDPAMVYSCAYFERGDETLAQAQQAKIDHVLTKLRLAPGQTLLDIGCGWGALVLRAAERFGARCLGITLSQNQFELATERVRAAGLQDRVEIRLQDYRDVTGQFDRVSSVGMFEHVGLKHLTDYFRIVHDRLAPEGWALNHGITSSDPHNGETRHGGGRFIDRYVFPRGELPHIGTVLTRAQEGGLEAFDAENLRRHYARTLALWSARFEAQAESLRALVDERRWRIWRMYLVGCQWAFEHDEIALYQVLCHRAAQPADALPWSRRWIYAPA